MTHGGGWDAEAAVARCPVIPWSGSAWRAHRRRYSPVDPGGSLRISGRYNRGLDQFPEDQAWPALYLALGRDICLGEIVRHLTPELLPTLNDYRVSEIAVHLQAALDARNPQQLGLPHTALWHDTDYSMPQALAAAALALGVEALLVPSATRLGDNLVVFTRQLRAASSLAVQGSVDPRLFISR
jgi:RES domain-containing protein